MLVKDCHRVINHNDLLGELRILVKRGEEERQNERIAITGAERVPERETCS